jgi:hypothetical protein
MDIPNINYIKLILLFYFFYIIIFLTSKFGFLIEPTKQQNMTDLNTDIYTRISNDMISMIKRYGPICNIGSLIKDMGYSGYLPVPSSFVTNILNLAVFNGSIFTIEVCLEIANPMSDTISIAAGTYTENLKLLLEIVDRESLDIDFNAVFKGETAIERATDNIENMQILLQRGAQITGKALINAARAGRNKNRKPLAFLLDEIENRNLHVDMDITHNNTNLLTEVIWWEFPKEIIYRLVKLGAKPTNSIIILSVMNYEYDIVKLFIDIAEKHNIPINLNMSIHATKELAIQWAVRNKQPDTVKLLLEHGAKPTNEAFVWAARHCDLDCMILLLAGAKRCKFVIDWTYKMCDSTALEWAQITCGFRCKGLIANLMLAICRGSETCFQDIFSGNINLTAYNNNMLNLAICSGSKAFVKAVLCAGAQPDKNALSIAIISGNRAIVKLLYNRVAKKYKWDLSEDTPYMISRRLKCHKIASYINNMEARQSFNDYEKMCKTMH